MTTPATHNSDDTTSERVLCMVFALREKPWKRGVTTGHGHKPRERGSTARPQERVRQEVPRAKERFGLPATALVVRCYEAGRAGFWLHRC
jgi:transposase